MIIPDEIISKNPVLEANIKKVEEDISKFSGTSEEKDELSNIIDEAATLSSEGYLFGSLSKDSRAKFEETFTPPVTFEETIAFVHKETGKSEEEIRKGLGEALSKTFSETLTELKNPDEVNMETKLPIK